MTKIKIYTEEQVRKLISIGISIGYSPAFDIDTKDASINKIIQEVTPIELPSDDDIYIEAQVKKDNIKKLPFDSASFQFGAIWLRDKIQGAETK